MPHLINIEKFFLKNSCCNSDTSAPCQKYHPNNRAINNAQVYFRHRFQRDNTLYAPTITIGNKRYGAMSAEDQYKNMVKDIKRVYNKGMEIKYLFYFELTQNGILHAHGVCDGYQNIFIDGFHKYGKHNTNDKSYPEIKAINYFDYIKKEYNEKMKYKPITNVNKIDLIYIPQPIAPAERLNS